MAIFRAYRLLEISSLRWSMLFDLYSCLISLIYLSSCFSSFYIVCFSDCIFCNLEALRLLPVSVTFCACFGISCFSFIDGDFPLSLRLRSVTSLDVFSYAVIFSLGLLTLYDYLALVLLVFSLLLILWASSITLLVLSITFWERETWLISYNIISDIIALLAGR